ncbi:MAG: GNAT family N-acetyltransferase [Mycoplasmoidaceae bacterium]
MELKRGFENINLKKVQELYDKCFQDSKEFSDSFFGSYKKYYDLWSIWDGENVVLMTTLVKKRISQNGKKLRVGLIVAVAVNEKYRGRGIMRDFMNNFLNEVRPIYDQIYIQATNWDLYKSFGFHACTKKYKSRLKKDQFLKSNNLIEKPNYDKCNKIYNDYVKMMKYENFSYRTTKENKQIARMILNAGDRIIQSYDCYIHISNNQVIDYAYKDFKNFMRLISTLPYDTVIWAHEILDKRFFNYLDEIKIETKILDKENLEVHFSEFF